ncbi:arginase family protein [Aestuariivirga litoralis]|uniref:arginase family protein n=1 Tax=Aestuariivirga litoralis TaxID=2650924 RepID=UPI0018C64287|nr:arginase family protein [Aestuariivirga litoralis]MBG1233141.1 agmatinase [Aestuariivirga litoralis]
MAKSVKPSPFLGTSFAKSAKGAQAAVFAAPHGTPYKGIDNRGTADSGEAIRTALGREAGMLSHWDFDFEGVLLPNPAFSAVDLGNLGTKPADGKGNRSLIKQTTTKILEAGAVPIMIGGDDSVPIPFIEAFSGGPPVIVLQIDAHIDWCDVRFGEKSGYSSTMRRASEMTHVWRIVQVGARGVGSGPVDDLNAAREWGAHLFTSRHVLQRGLDEILGQIEPGSHCVIALDLDALDSSIMPAVGYPTPGGLSFNHVIDLIAGVATRARIAGFSMVEFVPKRDLTGTAAFTAGRIAAHVLGHVCRQFK